MFDTVPKSQRGEKLEESWVKKKRCGGPVKRETTTKGRGGKEIALNGLTLCTFRQRLAPKEVVS